MSEKSENSICSKDQEIFEKGINQTKKRWAEPDIVKFEADFRKIWQSKRQLESEKKSANE
jgi:hypothetical protein